MTEVQWLAIKFAGKSAPCLHAGCLYVAYNNLRVRSISIWKSIRTYLQIQYSTENINIINLPSVEIMLPVQRVLEWAYKSSLERLCCIVPSVSSLQFSIHPCTHIDHQRQQNKLERLCCRVPSVSRLQFSTHPCTRIGYQRRQNKLDRQYMICIRSWYNKDQLATTEILLSTSIAKSRAPTGIRARGLGFILYSLRSLITPTPTP